MTGDDSGDDKIKIGSAGSVLALMVLFRRELDVLGRAARARWMVPVSGEVGGEVMAAAGLSEGFLSCVVSLSASSFQGHELMKHRNELRDTPFELCSCDEAQCAPVETMALNAFKNHSMNQNILYRRARNQFLLLCLHPLVYRFGAAGWLSSCIQFRGTLHYRLDTVISYLYQSRRVKILTPGSRSWRNTKLIRGSLATRRKDKKQRIMKDTCASKASQLTL